MRELLAHAASLGVSVHVAHLPAPCRGFYDHDNARVIYDFNLTPIERRCVVAHELGHAFYGHEGRGVTAQEDAADLYAARLLIDPGDYAALEQIRHDVQWIADELHVEPHLVRVFQRHMVRLDGVTYARSARGQFRLRWGVEQC